MIFFAGIRKSLTNDKYKKQKSVSQVQKKDAKTLSKGRPRLGGEFSGPRKNVLKKNV